MDLSYGHNKDHRFMSIVIGKDRDVEIIMGDLGHDALHMNRLYKNQQKHVFSKLRLKNRSVRIWCIKINCNIRKAVIKKNKGKKRFAIAKIYQRYNVELLRMIRGSMEEFLPMHGYAINDTCFQCDADCMGFIKDVGLPYKIPESAHMIAGIVAWANNRGMPIGGVIEMDRFEETCGMLSKIL